MIIENLVLFGVVNSGMLDWTIWSVILEYVNRQLADPRVVAFIPAGIFGMGFLVALVLELFQVSIPERIGVRAMQIGFAAVTAWAFVMMPHSDELMESYGVYGYYAIRAVGSAVLSFLAAAVVVWCGMMGGLVGFLICFAVRHPIRTVDVLIETYSPRHSHCR